MFYALIALSVRSAYAQRKSGAVNKKAGGSAHLMTVKKTKFGSSWS